MVDGKNCYHKIGNYSKTEKSEKVHHLLKVISIMFCYLDKIIELLLLKIFY